MEAEIPEQSDITIEKSDVVDEVKKSGVLGTSTHQIILFEYLMDAKFIGELHKVKAYTIAVDGFGRPADFDGSVDSIVRVEMFRLRANLREFNQRSKKYQLHLPKASYDIQIEKVAEIPDTRGEQDLKETKVKRNPFKPGARNLVLFPAILLAMMIGSFILGRNTDLFQTGSHCSDIVPNISIANTSSADELEAYIDQVLRGAASQFSHLHIVDNINDCRKALSPGYEIEYSVFQDNTTYRTTLSVYSTASHHLISSQSLSGSLHAGLEKSENSNDELYFDLVTAINDWLKPGGVVHDHAVTEKWGQEVNRTDYSCISIMYNSFVSDSDADYQNALNCLEGAYDRKTPLLDNLGGLAASYIAQQQNIHSATINNPEEPAARIMNEIGARWDQQVETVVAKIYFESERVDYNSQRMRDTLLMAEKKYNSNPIVLLEISKHAGFRLGDWPYAKRISDKVKYLQSERDNSVFFVDAAYSLMFEVPEAGLENCIRAFSENSRLSNLLVNACATRAGNDNWVAITEANLQKLGLETVRQKKDYVQSRNFDSHFKKTLIDIWT